MMASFVSNSASPLYSRTRYLSAPYSPSLNQCRFKVGLVVVVVESADTSIYIYICFAEDPLLINRWDPDFFNQLSEALHQRLQQQHRSSRVRTNNQFDSHTQDSSNSA